MKDSLICYDITAPKRLVRLHRFLKKQAIPLQYSVFLFTGDDHQLDRLMQQAVSYIDVKADDLRAYPLPKRGFRARLGHALLPEGIQLSSLPPVW